jgi:hypothetical protein
MLFVYFIVFLSRFYHILLKQRQTTVSAMDTDLLNKSANCFCRRFHGNSFEGPIPSSFSMLTSLDTL